MDQAWSGGGNTHFKINNAHYDGIGLLAGIWIMGMDRPIEFFKMEKIEEKEEGKKKKKNPRYIAVQAASGLYLFSSRINNTHTHTQ